MNFDSMWSLRRSDLLFVNIIVSSPIPLTHPIISQLLGACSPHYGPRHTYRTHWRSQEVLALYAKEKGH
jgi:nitroreductase